MKGCGFLWRQGLRRRRVPPHAILFVVMVRAEAEHTGVEVVTATGLAMRAPHDMWPGELTFLHWTRQRVVPIHEPPASLRTAVSAALTASRTNSWQRLNCLQTAIRINTWLFGAVSASNSESPLSPL